MASECVRKIAPRIRMVGAIVLAGLACDEAAVRDPPPAPPLEGMECSQARREIARWLGREDELCRFDVSGLLEVTPLGDGRLLFRRRFSTRDEVWTMLPDGTFAPEKVFASQIDEAVLENQGIASQVAGFVFLPRDDSSGREPRLLVYDPRRTDLILYTIDPPREPAHSEMANAVLTPTPRQYWPADTAHLWKTAANTPWDRQFLGLEDGYLLDWDPADGSSRIWRLVMSNSGQPTLTGPTALAGGPREEFRRGHRLVYLGRGRLLSWAPCSARTTGLTEPCVGSAYHIWDYTLDSDQTPRDPFASLPTTRLWPEIGAQDAIVVADPAHLVVWSGSTGTLRSYPLVAGAAEPLAGAPIATLQDDSLVSRTSDPPSASPIKKLVVILQDGRSFDSYFGRYCETQPRADGRPLDCHDGAACCEAIPSHISDQCVRLDPAETYAPNSKPACLRLKMNGGAMDAFGTPTTAPDGTACGDPRDVACAAPEDGAGAVGEYHILAGSGAIADRFFQSYAFTDDASADGAADPFTWNLLYLSAARFAPPNLELESRPLLTKELLRNQVDWAIYAGPGLLPFLRRFGLAIFHDPAWSPYRSLVVPANRPVSEFEYDLALGHLPAVSILLPDRSDDLQSESPGKRFDNGLRYVSGVVEAIKSSPHADETLILITYLTAGGYYDHVPPPPAPPPDVDATLQGKAVHYGPRVPLLALGRFARTQYISHVQLEMSSITVFAEWNWLYGQAIKGAREQTDPRRYRDTAANNLGSLLDPALGVPED
jgi:hypothetical protein